MVAFALIAACKKDEPPAPLAGVDAFTATWGSNNDDAAGALAVLDDGGVIVGLTLANPARMDAFLARLDRDGGEVFQTRWGREFDEELHAALVVDGVARLGGALWNQDAVAADLRGFVLDVDLDSGEVLGNPAWEWNATGARDAVHALLPLGGDTLAVGWGDDDVMLARIDPDGDPVDEVLRDGGEREEIEHATLAGDLVVGVGRSKDDLEQDDDGDLLVTAFTTALEPAWTLEWGDDFRAEDRGFGVASDGATVVAVGGAAAGDAVLLGVDLDGNLLWETLWDSGGADVGRAVAIEPEGTALVAVDASGDVALLRIDVGTGDVLDEVTWGGDGMEGVRDLVVGDDRGCLAGTVTGGPDGQDQALVACFERVALALAEAQ